MADKSKTKSKKGAKESGGKGSDKNAPYTSVATHPRAYLQVRAAKGWGGLIGFAGAALLSIKASVPAFQVLERALLFGIIGYLVAWALSVLVWRQLMLAEQRAAVEELERRRAERESQEAEPIPSRRAPAAAGSAGRPSA